ncbi:SCO family protein [Tenacibaculum maritimum]|uniref:SCO2/SenC family protein n=1 Tax=Tenacibaculum maritimum NCIMB 2154 TaxID=1349785 RepID=A0A2H1E6X4_9FLAO|nr:SCO family protein [Tenacibaculum maritimum]MCD9561867.1 SCO family protein [Tenacibaculum maritimum]MCD9565019.1 SCO family protein [Tenacibaculum maritimum]MCD9578992.1 SCO family protein [Tenacibaculum maritimum]MCD9584055.1 SCO family protein [Tenacibaculum maritimum]MCD9595846.1 SCO family protein [Tenacibaculum maritimum]
MNKKYSYVGISFIILLFGIYVVPKVVARFKKPQLATFNKVPSFEFINQDGKKITNNNFKGKVYVVEFFFSTCTTICPLMTTKMVELQDEFFGNPNFGIASFSITPERDTPYVLKEYAKRNKILAKNWHLLTTEGADDIVYNLANKGFKLYAGKDDRSTDGFEHSGLFALVDKEGYIRSRYDEFGNPIMYYRALEENEFSDQIKELKEDIKLLLNE